MVYIFVAPVLVTVHGPSIYSSLDHFTSMLEQNIRPKSLKAPSAKRPKSECRDVSTTKYVLTLVTQIFSTTTLMLIGALIQGLLILAVPRIWMLAPTIIVLCVRFFDTLAITLRFRPNPYLEDVIFPKWCVNVPDADGNISTEPAAEKVAVIMICLKINHPLGMLAPLVKEIGGIADAMSVELDNNAESNGFFGQSAWSTTDSRGATELMLLSYWRSIEDIHKYAEGPTHREGLVWWDKYAAAGKVQHIGIDHELFEAPKHKWEKISINFQPTRLGATSFLRKGDKLIGGTVDDQWISPIVEARHQYRTSRGRLNWQEGENELLKIRKEY